MAFCLVAAPVMAQDSPPLTFRALQWGFVIGDAGDLGLTLYACRVRGYQESNALFDPHRPVQMLVLSAALDFAVVGLENVLWKNSRPLAWAVAIAAVLVKGYVIYKNIQTLGR